MAIDFENDLDVFINANDFGQTCSFQDNIGVSHSFSAIFDNAFAGAVYGDLVLETTTPILTCKSSDIAAMNNDNAVIISGVVYRVVQIQPDGTGLSYVVLTSDYL